MDSNNISISNIPRIFPSITSVLRLTGALLLVASLAACNSGSSGSGVKTDNTGGVGTGPVQNASSVVTEINHPVTIDILSEAVAKKGAPIAGEVILSIESAPENGSAVILEDNHVSYIPGQDYVGQDSFMFKVADDSGTFAVGTIAIGIICSTCEVSDSRITLSWIPLPDTTLTYIVYFGDSPTTADIVASETQASEASFYLAQLGLHAGDTLCFRLRARNEVGISGFSEPVCSIV